jgi:hypothetical protein
MSGILADIQQAMPVVGSFHDRAETFQGMIFGG